MNKKRILLLIAALFFFGHSLWRLERFLESERKRLDPALQNRNFERRSYFEKHFSLTSNDLAFGSLSILFEAGINSSVHLSGRIHISLLNKNHMISFSLSVFSDRFHLLERFLIFITSPGFSAPMRIEGTFSGNILRILWEGGGIRQNFELPFSFRPLLRNPLYPFHETLNTLERTRNFPVPRILYFRDPRNRDPVTFALTPVDETIRFHGRKAQGYRIEKTPVPAFLFFYADGQLAGARFGTIRLSPSENDLLEPESVLRFSDQWIHSNLRELQRWLEQNPDIPATILKTGG